MGEVPAERFMIEAPMLAPLPRRRFDTAYSSDPAGARGHPPDRVAGRAYSVPPQCLGQKVEVRHEVDSSIIEIRWAGEVVGTHTVGDPQPARCGTPGTGRPPSGQPSVAAVAVTCRSWSPMSNPSQVPLRLDIEGDVDVEVPDLSRYGTRPGRDQLPL